MIASRDIPDDYLLWNRKWGAPFGTRVYILLSRLPVLRSVASRMLRLRGYFGFEHNNSTREFEYPWAFSATTLHEGMKALELGAGWEVFSSC
jgi:hypothetical protein